jgi:hypothetical protein
MEEKKATEVKCPTCNKNPKILIYEKGVFAVGGILFFLACLYSNPQYIHSIVLVSYLLHNYFNKFITNSNR